MDICTNTTINPSLLALMNCPESLRNIVNHLIDIHQTSKHVTTRRRQFDQATLSLQDKSLTMRSNDNRYVATTPSKSATHRQECGVVFVSAKLSAALRVLISAVATSCGQFYIEVVGNVDNVSTHEIANCGETRQNQKTAAKDRPRQNWLNTHMPQTICGA